MLRKKTGGSTATWYKSAPNPAILPKNEFRNVLNIGNPLDPSDDFLRGALIGLRVDLQTTS